MLSVTLIVPCEVEYNRNWTIALMEPCNQNFTYRTPLRWNHHNSEVNISDNCLQWIFFFLCNDLTQSIESTFLVYLFWQFIQYVLFIHNELKAPVISINLCCLNEVN
ncbi:UNVERIFIED_CONTAM: hypothetical protein NCL1_41150 [Trichonephila clavipes]